MKIKIFFLLFSTLVSMSCSSGTDGILPWRWVFVHGKNLNRPADVREINRIAATAAEHGLNGMVLSAGFDRLDLQSEKYFEGLTEVLGQPAAGHGDSDTHVQCLLV